MPANIQIIRGSAPALQIGTPAVPPQTFTSHLPRGMPHLKKSSVPYLFSNLIMRFCPGNVSCAGAAAAAVMSSSKTVLRPATGASTGPGQPTVQHIIHQTIQVLMINCYPIIIIIVVISNNPMPSYTVSSCCYYIHSCASNCGGSHFSDTNSVASYQPDSYALSRGCTWVSSLLSYGHFAE